MTDAPSKVIARNGGASDAGRVSSRPRANWISRLVKSVADFFRRRRFARNRARLRPPPEQTGRGAKA